MIQVFRTDEDYKKWLDGQTLPSGIVVYVSDNETMYFSTNNIKGELKTYECKKEEPIQYPPLVYSTNAAGSTITVNGETVTLGQGDNITLDYPNEITSLKATNNTALTAITIPNTVVSINDNAFTGCTELTDFNYNGTVEEWGAITLGTDWNKDAAFTVVHCTDGDVTLEEPIQPIQHEYVDLGLPSGLKWAKCNVGAEKETDAGLYFAWGETTGYTASQVGTDKQFLWSDYKYGNSSSNLTKYNQSDGKTVLESADDAAAQIMGSDWRMPTKDEFQELLNNTTNEWIANYEGTGVSGRKFTSNTDTSKYIFIPAAGNCRSGSVYHVGYDGYVWTSLLPSNHGRAWYLNFNSDSCDMFSSERFNGWSVRGVRK